MFFLKQPQTTHFGVLIRNLTFDEVSEITNNLLIDGYCDLTKYVEDSNNENVVNMVEKDYFEYLG